MTHGLDQLSLKSCQWALHRVTVPWIQSRLAAYLWFRPARKSPGEKFAELCAKGASNTLAGAKGGPIRTWNGEAEKPSIHIVHGWGGRWDQFSVLIEHLRVRGYTVVAQDFPGHGEGMQSSSDLLRWMSELKRQSLQSPTSPKVFVCHSFGLVSVAHGILSAELEAAAVIAINPPTRFDFLMTAFLRKNRLPAKLAKQVEHHVSHRVPYARDMSDIDIPRLAGSVPLLYVADQSDREVPFTEHGAAQALLGERFVTTRGFGHNRILASPPLLSSVTQFLDDLTRAEIQTRRMA